MLHNSPLIHRLKFYADLPTGQKNVKFTWRVPNKQGCFKALQRFKAKGYVIRAAWYDIVIKGGIRYHNERIPTDNSNG